MKNKINIIFAISQSKNYKITKNKKTITENTM